MRMLMQVTVPVEHGNTAVQEGRLQAVVGQTLDRLKPEAAYFYPDEQGRRTALLVFDLADPSDIPGIVEPLFQGVHAAVRFVPVMNAEDLRRGLSTVADEARGYSLSGAQRPASMT